MSVNVSRVLQVANMTASMVETHGWKWLPFVALRNVSAHLGQWAKPIPGRDEYAVGRVVIRDEDITKQPGSEQALALVVAKMENALASVREHESEGFVNLRTDSEADDE